MLMRLWFVLSVAWAALVFLSQSEPGGRLVGVALFPLIAGPVLVVVVRWVVRGRG
jgi:hypothetical protein